jgi:hypothetical protein
MKLGTRSRVDREAVERYIGRIVEFREKLAVLMHIARDIKRPAKQHHQGRAPQYFHRRRYGDVCNAVPRGIQRQWRRQDHRPIFGAQGGRVGGVVFVVGVAVPAAVRGVGVGEGGRIVAHVACRPLSREAASNPSGNRI